MEERHFNSAEEFLEIFELGEEDNHYYDPIIFSDAKAGFSIKRNYPKNIRYKPPLNRTGEPDSVAMFWINYTHPDDVRKLAKHEGTSRGVPTVARIKKLNKYLQNHFDYDNDNDESPTSEQVEASNRTPQPIGLEFFSDFYYNHEEKRFIDTQDRQYRPRELLDHIFKLHCNTVHPWKGLWLRARLAGRDRMVRMLPRLSGFIIWFLKVVFGRTLVNDDIMYIYSRGCQNEDFKRQNENTIKPINHHSILRNNSYYGILGLLRQIYQGASGLYFKQQHHAIGVHNSYAVVPGCLCSLGHHQVTKFYYWVEGVSVLKEISN